mgnify:CR=1 FL=1
MQEKIEKGEVDIVVVDITTYKKVPSIQDYLKDSLGKINMADIGKEAKLPPPSFASLSLRGRWR